MSFVLNISCIPHNRLYLVSHKALTPILAGSISGSIVGAAWIIGFIVYFYKRHRREKRARALGFKSHREMLDPLKKPEPFIIPPDPAIVEGKVQPGERIVIEHKKHKHKHHHHGEASGNGHGEESVEGIKHTATIPMSHAEEEEREALQEEQANGSSSSESSPNSQRPSTFPHTRSAPSEVQTTAQDDPRARTPTSPITAELTTPLIRPPERAHTSHS